MLACIQCGELHENIPRLLCEGCELEGLCKEDRECADCAERGGECLPCKIAREDWVVTPLANGKVKYAD